MKRLLFLAILAVSLVSCASCSKNTATLASNNTNQTGSKMKIKIGNSTLTAKLYDNATATAFKSLLLLTVNIAKLNGNEKYVEWPRNIPTNASSNPGTVQKGDWMLYGSSTLVLFYKKFFTFYSYTELGRIDDITGLVAALGSGNVSMTYQLE